MHKLALPLVALVFALFYPVLGFDFVRWDDDINVTGNPLVAEPWSSEVWAGMFSGEQAMRFKPLHWLLFRAVHGTAGFDPRAWHAIGLVCHVLATGLFFWGLVLLYRRSFPAIAPKAAAFCAGACALIWAMHPLRVEAVAWVTASTYPFTAAFAFGAWICFLRAVDSPSGNARRACFVAAWVLSVCSFLSYPVALLLPALFFALELGALGTAPRGWWRLGDAGARRWLFRHALFFAPAVAAAGMTLATRYLHPGIFDAAPTLARHGVGDRILAALAALGSFPVKFFAPLDLTPNQVAMQVDGSWRANVFLAAGLAVAGATGFGLYRRRAAGAGWVVGGYCALALPCLGLTELPTWPPDRYSYLLDAVLVGVIGALGLRCVAGEGKARIFLKPAIAGGAVFGGLLLFQTRLMLPAWRDTDALFTYMSASPRFADRVEQQAHVYRLWSYYYGAKSDFDKTVYYLGEARRVFREAITASLRSGNIAKAIKLACAQEHSVGIDENLRRERGGWWLRCGRLDEARRDLEQAAKARPDDPRTRELLKQLEEAAPK